MPFGHLWEGSGFRQPPGGVPEPSRHVFGSSSRDHSATPHPHWFFRSKASAFFYAFTLEALVLVKRLILSALVILTGSTSPLAAASRIPAGVVHRIPR